MRRKRQNPYMKRKKGFNIKRTIFAALILLLVVIPISVSVYHHFKDIPEGISFEGDVHETSEFQFLYDLTYETDAGEVAHEQEIFDYVFQMIEDAEDFIVLDLFLFNNDYDHTNPDLDFPPLSKDLADALVAKKENSPDVAIVFITDPINSFYGTYIPNHVQAMVDSGVEMIFTDLKPLRDSNPVYSGFARSYLQWFGTSDAAYLPNIFRKTGPKVNIQSFFGLLHFKANHRKTVMNEKEALITSGNPHDASFYHSKIPYVMQANVLNDFLASERAVAEMSGFNTTLFDSFTVQSDPADTDEMYSVQLLTEQKIKNSVLASIEDADAGDKIKMGMFYLSDRDVIEALWDAQERDVAIQMILDINQDAFGNEKVGIPNRPVADELTKDESTIEVRWYHSHGEQFHSKFMLVESGDDLTMIGGSTNFTRRNMADYNLETNVEITGNKALPEMADMLTYFDRIWNNEDGTYTVDYSAHAESSTWKNWLYRFQEWSGLSTF